METKNDEDKTSFYMDYQPDLNEESEFIIPEELNVLLRTYIRRKIMQIASIKRTRWKSCTQDGIRGYQCGSEEGVGGACR